MRRNDIDYSRAIAILLILIGHSDGMADLCVKLIYSFHVPLFFIISGMLMRYNGAVSHSWLHLGKSRLIRTVIPSVMWEIILSVFYFFIKHISVKDLVINSLTMNFNLSVLWFIPCMLLAEALLLGLLKAYRKLSNKEDPMMFCIVVIFVFGIAGIFMNVLFVKRVFIATVFFAFGYSFERLRENKKANRIISHWSICSACAVAWIVSAVFNTKPDLSAGNLGNCVLYFISSVFGSIAIIIVCGWVKFNVQPFVWIGRNTFGFLVTHVFVRHLIIAFGEKLFDFSVEGALLAGIMILTDIAMVWFIQKTVPEIIGQKRKKRMIKE